MSPGENNKNKMATIGFNFRDHINCMTTSSLLCTFWWCQGL